MSGTNYEFTRWKIRLLSSAILCCTVLCCVFIFSRTAIANSLTGAQHSASSSVQAGLVQPRLSGNGRLNWFGLRVYDAHLWVAQGFEPQRFTQHAIALELQYLRTLQGKQIAQRSSEEITKLGLGTPEQLKVWDAFFLKTFPNVRDGDRITGIWVPAQGTTFELNGQVIGKISGEDFARAFFGIWLDPRTSQPKLRLALLQHAQPNQ